MGRNRVLSFMSQFSGGTKAPTPTPSPPNDSPLSSASRFDSKNGVQEPFAVTNGPATPPSNPDDGMPVNISPISNTSSLHRRSDSRPRSMVSAHQPPLMEINEDTIPELMPIFTFLNSHANKLYQEGYFLKLDDQNTQGRLNDDRTWTECFAQLVGTVLSLWDAAELDAAGEDGEVLPKFINLTDASIKMIDSLPTRSADEQPLQNILSISTAGRNRYLLHFNSHHSLVQWTAGIRLAIFEHSILQEAYTGALIAGKGKTLNNIGVIMERARFKTEEWVRVRFGAGVPWRRCWCVITPPDEKEYAKQAKEMKKKSPYDRTAAPVLKGTIHFYDQRKDGKKQKKAQPIASITDAYSAYAIYPQAKSLIDASTLLKIEGHITVHSDPPTSSEGFVFIMPETRPAITGFEMLLRFLFPTWDTFGLYGRPGRLVASTLDPKSLMFAMPKHRRYGYLEIIDVASLLVDDNSSSWSEREWRRRLKEVTGARMNAMDESGRTHSRSNSRQSSRLSNGISFGGAGRPRVGFAEDGGSVRSSRSMSLSNGQRADLAAPGGQGNRLQPAMASAQGQHVRNSSDPNMTGGSQPYLGPNGPFQGSPQRMQLSPQDKMGPGANPTPPANDFDGIGRMNTPEPVSQPPALRKGQGRPKSTYHSPEMRRANSRLSSNTLAQMANAVGLGPKEPLPRDAATRPNGEEGVISGPSVLPQAASFGSSANDPRSREALNPPSRGGLAAGSPNPLDLSKQRSRSPMGRPPPGPQAPYGPGPNSPAYPPSEGRRSPYPPGQGGPGARPGAPQNMAYRPDPGRPGPGGRPGMPGGVPPSGQGRPPNPGGPPSDPRDPYGAQRPPPGSRPPFAGPQGPPMAPPHRKPMPGRGPPPGGPIPSATDAILDSYAADDVPPPGPPMRPSQPGERRPLPPGHHASSMVPEPAFHDERPSDRSYTPVDNVERPRAGVLKTVGNSESVMPPKTQYDIPDVNFGPTVNYGAPQRTQPGGAPPNPAFSGRNQRPYSPAGGRPVAPPHRTPDFRPGDGSRTAAWQPPSASPGPGGSGVNAEQYVQQRAAVSAAQYSHGRTPSGNIMSDTQVKRRSSFDMLNPSKDQGRSPLPRPSSQGGVPDAWERERRQMQSAGDGRGPQNPGHQYQPQPPPHGMPFQQQERSMSPAMGRGREDFGPGGPQPSAYGQPSSFSRPLRAGQPQPRPLDPRLMPPQGQYAAPQSPRNVHPQYQGQAF